MHWTNQILTVLSIMSAFKRICFPRSNGSREGDRRSPFMIQSFTIWVLSKRICLPILNIKTLSSVAKCFPICQIERLTIKHNSINKLPSQNKKWKKNPEQVKAWIYIPSNQGPNQVKRKTIKTHNHRRQNYLVKVKNRRRKKQMSLKQQLNHKNLI